jgi:hypothetical protein
MQANMKDENKIMRPSKEMSKMYDCLGSLVFKY